MNPINNSLHISINLYMDINLYTDFNMYIKNYRGNIYKYIFKDNTINLKTNISNHRILFQLQLIYPTFSIEKSQLPPLDSISHCRQVKLIPRSHKFIPSLQSIPFQLWLINLFPKLDAY